jgi:hypothetical protein
MASATLLEKRLQIAGVALITGLLIEALCLIFKGPLAFVIFVAVGGLALFVGVVVYLVSLIMAPNDQR